MLVFFFRSSAKNCSTASSLKASASRSGGTSGLSIGHVSPEAASGGNIALIEEGDTIEIDIPNRRLHLAVDDAELARRREGWQPLEKPVPAGFMRRYRKHVLPACEGAILD